MSAVLPPRRPRAESRLATDLKPAAVASLKPEAVKLNEKARELMKRIDDTIATTNRKIGALRPE